MICSGRELAGADEDEEPSDFGDDEGEGAEAQRGLSARGGGVSKASGAGEGVATRVREEDLEDEESRWLVLLTGVVSLLEDTTLSSLSPVVGLCGGMSGVTTASTALASSLATSSTEDSRKKTLKKERLVFGRWTKAWRTMTLTGPASFGVVSYERTVEHPGGPSSEQAASRGFSLFSGKQPQ